ncbi:hypothetical protein G6F31_020286 [Rhizopus arrhizus]|nr:hypothetical protein G6F31_020286 [Rhizopus arrhizus]
MRASPCLPAALAPGGQYRRCLFALASCLRWGPATVLSPGRYGVNVHGPGNEQAGGIKNRPGRHGWAVVRARGVSAGINGPWSRPGGWLRTGTRCGVRSRRSSFRSGWSWRYRGARR